ncbi:hypothetical protein LCGC14_0395440 [marine sediment metagenome]|uniref:Uncharacterized protein n=1 Tax=marine sediment metagenome TaxID=412755 RepID=A0A0F9W7F9_9ZZZZ
MFTIIFQIVCMVIMSISIIIIFRCAYETNKMANEMKRKREEEE